MILVALDALAENRESPVGSIWGVLAEEVFDLMHVATCRCLYHGRHSSPVECYITIDLQRNLAFRRLLLLRVSFGVLVLVVLILVAFFVVLLLIKLHFVVRNELE